MKNVTILIVIFTLFFAAFFVANSIRPKSDLALREQLIKKGEKPPKIFVAEDDSPKKGDPGFEPEKKPSEWFFVQRAYPHNEIKFESVQRALKQARADHQKAQTREEGEWEFAGPTNIGGRIADIAVDPTDTDKIYVATATGGVLRSTDGGTNWEAIFDDVGVSTIGAIAVDPDNPQTIYVGTGEANANSYSFFGEGMYKSTDGGDTWTHIGLEETRYIGRIVVDPSNTDKIFVAASGKLFGTCSNRGIYRSLNGGQDWEQVLFVSDSTSATDIAINPQDPDIVYAAMWERKRALTYRKSGGWTTGLWRSTDGGDTWTEMLSGLPKGAHVGRPGISVCASNPDYIYAIYADHPGYFLGIYKTTNGGDTWTQTNDSFLSNIFSSFGWYFGQIRVNPSDPDQVYALGVSLHRSDDGGASWITLADYGNSDEIHVDHHALWMNPDTGYIIEGNDGGIYYSSDYGDNWVKSPNMPNIQFYAIAIDHSAPYRLYGGTQDNGTLRTWYGGIDDWDHILGGDGFYCIVHPDNSNIIWAESQFGNLYKSVDGGEYFTYATWGISSDDRKNWSTPVVMDPNDPDVMYYGANRLYKSTDGAESWFPISEDLTHGGQVANQGTITTIAVAKVDPQTIYLGTDDGNVWVTYDGGENWNEADFGVPERWITRVEVDPTDAMIAYVTVSGFRWEETQPHVLRTVFGGMSWQDISGDLPDAPVNVIVVDPEDTETLYVGTDFGVYYTTNLGNTWTRMGTNFPICPVLDLKLHNPTRKLVAGTHGRSMFTIDLEEFFTKVEEEEIAEVPTKATLAQNYPNPFNATTTISYELPESQEISLIIYNSTGQLVKRYDLGNKESGKHSLVWQGKDESGKDVASGVYLYRLEGENWSKAKKMQLVK